MKKTERILVAVGGGESSEVTEDSLKIIEKFVELAGGPEKARIIIMTVATDHPKDAEARYREFFERLKVKNFEMLDISLRSQSFDEEIIKKVGEATGLYFTGGDQLHVTTLVGGTPLSDLIAEKFEKGMVIGGTSAGAMMISSSMILSGASDCVPRLGSIDVVPGMNYLKDAVIDTHFSQRGRHGRLLAAVARNPQVLGLGIDERTAMIVRDDIFETIGEGAVTVVCAKESAHTNLPYIGKDDTLGIFDVGFHVLPEGYQYDLKKRDPIPMPVKKIMGATNDE